MRRWVFALALVASAPAAAFSQVPGGELTFTPTSDPQVFAVTGVLQQKTGNVPVETTAKLSGNVLTYALDEKVTSFIAALDHTGPVDVHLSYSLTLPENASPAGTWTLSGASTGVPAGGGPGWAKVASGDGTAWQKLEKQPASVPAPGVDPVVARAMAVTPAQEAAVQATLQKQFGVRPKHWLGFLVPPTGPPIAAAVKAAVAATGNRLDPAWLYTIAIGEGLPLYFSDQKAGEKPPLDGFEYLGTDTFSGRAAALKKEGFLPASFAEGKDYVPVEHVNELGQTVKSAEFKTLAGGLTALGSLLLDSQSRVEKDAAQVWGPKTKLTPDELRFWTYFDFNVGSTACKKFMEEHPASWADHRTGPERTDQREGKYNSIARVATARWLDDLGVFGGAPKTTAPAVATSTAAHQANQPLGD